VNHREVGDTGVRRITPPPPLARRRTRSALNQPTPTYPHAWPQIYPRRRQRRHRAMGDIEEAIATLLRNKAVTGMTHHQPPPPWPTAVKVSGQGTVPRLGTRSPQRRSRQGGKGALVSSKTGNAGTERERGEISTHQFCQMKHSRTYMYIYYWFSSCFCRG
jgi:hypothetical protein